MSILSVDSVVKVYHLGKTEIRALKGISFDVQHGDFLSIVGPSGCGKTTLLNIIGLIDDPTEGQVYFESKDMSSISDDQSADTRLQKIGFIFQSFNLIPVLNIIENIEFPMILDKVPEKERKKRIDFLVSAVGLREFVDHKPDELSGGQRQRVAIARSLVNNPTLVIADEPTANLDSETGSMVVEVMRELNQKEEVTFVFSTHNPEVMKYAGRIIYLRDGRLDRVEQGQRS